MSEKPRDCGASRTVVAAAIAIACLLHGCGRSNPEPPPPDILKAQREALEKARATDKMVQDAAQRRDAEMQSQQKQDSDAQSPGR
jgi:hypothetical protein